MPVEFERSVIDMGQGSYVITLPKPWVRYLGIRPGNKLKVISDGELVIRCQCNVTECFDVIAY